MKNKIMIVTVLLATLLGNVYAESRAVCVAKCQKIGSDLRNQGASAFSAGLVVQDCINNTCPPE